MRSFSSHRLLMPVYPRAVFLVISFLFGLSSVFGQEAKRALNSSDIDGWVNFSATTMSPSGKWIAYGAFPQHGDGEIVMQHLSTAREIRVPAGAIPPLPFPRVTHPDERRPKPETPSLIFTADNRFLISTTFPALKTLANLRKASRKHNPKFSRTLTITRLFNGKSEYIPQVKSVQVPTLNGGWIAYQLPPDPRNRKASYTIGSTLVLRDLETGSERSFPHVTEYQFSRDGLSLIYVVSSPKTRKNGVYVYSPEDSSSPRALLSGKSQHVKLTWNNAQTQAAFLSKPISRRAKDNNPWRLYLWDRGDRKVTLVPATTWAALSNEMQLSENAAPSYTRDDQKLIIGVAKPAIKPKPAPKDLADIVVADIWSGHDGLIQTRQAVLSKLEEKRTFSGLFDLKTKRYTLLADEKMTDVIISENGTHALGCDFSPYERLRDFDATYCDVYTINAITGARKLVIEKLRGESGDEGKPSLRFSPIGNHALYFQNAHWRLLDLATGQSRNLTSSMPVPVFRELHDKPEPHPASGWAGWNHDSQSVLIYDRYDIWQLSIDGRLPINLTRGHGRENQIIYRLQRIAAQEKGTPRAHPDFTQPLILRGESETTRASGFFRLIPGSETDPEKLLWGDKNYRYAGRALKADALMLTAQRFDEFPDVWITNEKLTTPRKVTDGGEQLKPFLWGSAELIDYQNSQGIPLQAALYKPDNFDPNKKYPLIVYTYERLSRIVHQFFSPVYSSNISFPFYTSNGYLVMLADIAYTTGEPGPSALDAVNSALDTVIARGYVDEDALGIQGSSWGGYTGSYIITQTNRFRAAEAGAIVSNMTSAYAGIRWTSGQPRLFQYEQSQSRIGQPLAEAPDLYLKNSPVFHANKVETPLLILHNDRDGAVPWTQAVEYYLALRRYEKDVWLINYNDEGHGIGRRANLKDFSKRMWQYFDHYLRGAPVPDWLTQGVPYLDRTAEKLRFNDDVSWPEKR